MLLIIFWFCVAVVLYTYLGYGILIYFLARWRPYKAKVSLHQISTTADLPEITLFIAAYNEADIIPAKMENCLALDYPADRLHILWVIDGSTDASKDILQNYPSVQIVHSAERRGKTAAINHGIQSVDTPLVVFSDANCMLNREALRRIAFQFADESIGCVSGEKRIAFEEEDTISSKGEGLYWEYESFLKKMDFQYYSAVGAAGELYAIRTAFFVPMREDTLLDDFMLSMEIAKNGYRIAYTPDAYAVERGSLNMEEESKRKKRIAAGGWQSMIWLWPLLNIFKYGKLSFQYISHRVLRWSITPFALFALLPLSLILAQCDKTSLNVFYVILVFQIVFYICAAVGYLKKDNTRVSKIFYVPYYFIFMNINVLLGVHYLLRKRPAGIWEKSKRK